MRPALIHGEVTSAGVPVIAVELSGRVWEAIIDTGFNGDLELPLKLKALLSSRYIGEITSVLAGGLSINEDAYQVRFPFDGETVLAEATFVEGEQILIGTRILRRHRLQIDFPARALTLDRM